MKLTQFGLRTLVVNRKFIVANSHLPFIQIGVIIGDLSGFSIRVRLTLLQIACLAP